MGKLRIYIADGSSVFCEGLKAIIKSQKKMMVCGVNSTFDDLQAQLEKTSPDILIIDYAARNFDMEKLQHLRDAFPAIKFMAITPELPRKKMLSALQCGLNSYLLKDCSREEILEAIDEISAGKQFYCGNIFSLLQNNAEEELVSVCDGISLSSREIEIIKLIAEGLTNKEIADKLFLSAHTINTHRKNLMQKLGIKNTAGIVIYAFKENLIVAE